LLGLAASMSPKGRNWWFLFLMSIPVCCTNQEQIDSPLGHGCWPIAHRMSVSGTPPLHLFDSFSTQMPFILVYLLMKNLFENFTFQHCPLNSVHPSLHAWALPKRMERTTSPNGKNIFFWLVCWGIWIVGKFGLLKDLGKMIKKIRRRAGISHPF
jgi:hypothetical protein